MQLYYTQHLIIIYTIILISSSFQDIVVQKKVLQLQKLKIDYKHSSFFNLLYASRKNITTVLYSFIYGTITIITLKLCRPLKGMSSHISVKSSKGFRNLFDVSNVTCKRLVPLNERISEILFLGIYETKYTGRI